MSRTRCAFALSAALAAGGIAMAAAPASAMPRIDPGVATSSDLAQVKPENVRWVCNYWGRCWWRPNVYRPYWGPRPFYGRPWGWRRGWGWRRHW
ncbi:MAG: hypothetical protein KGM42_07490 [Hyphomicrobiales bacterium]|nr:hypothetical protein [Hyphomicrobiales bacterium]